MRSDDNCYYDNRFRSSTAYNSDIYDGGPDDPITITITITITIMVLYSTQHFTVVDADCA